MQGNFTGPVQFYWQMDGLCRRLREGFSLHAAEETLVTRVIIITKHDTTFSLIEPNINMKVNYFSILNFNLH